MQKRIRLLLPITLCLFSFSLISCKDNNNASTDSSTEYTTESVTHSEKESSSLSEHSTERPSESSSQSEEGSSWSDENVDNDGWI